ncbi:MAG TPA: tail fiber domain-containing protein, partial [Pyrinomonadaceae bacterium]|nr:tail fiber domain-containing protein [Pyrinomonadaceae bacterium]
KNKTYLPSVLSIVFAIACFSVSALAQSNDDKNQFASLNSSGSSVRWDVRASHVASTLTVVGPDGEVFAKEFQGGQSPEFQLTDKKGDGVYTYELRLTPNIAANVKEQLKAAREKGNSEAVQRDLKRRGALPEPLVQSGSFSVVNGMIIVGGITEPGRTAMVPRQAAPATVQAPAAVAASSGRINYKINRNHARFMFFDQVIPDDLIVQGSVCAGLDCVNNENFGFDTIRVKENNTRIQFDDTSSSAGFATNNWQIRANDSASGGASFLGFVDQGATGNSETGTIVFAVDAGARANALRVNSASNVGLGTSTPVLDFHINVTDTPAIRLEQNNSGGFTAQTWDIGANEANFFVRDVTGGSRLSLRIRPGAPTSSLDIAANGNVGLGTASPNARLDLKQFSEEFIGGLQLRRSTTNDTWGVVTGADNNLYFGYANDASLANAHADFTVIPLVVTSSNRVGIGTTAPDQTLSVNGNASKVGGGSWATFSDRRLKNIKSPFNTGLKAVMQLQPVRYEYRSDNALKLNSEGEHVGFAAQDVKKVIPEAVTANSSGYLMVNNDPIIWTMLNAIKEQQKEITELKRQIRQLRATRRRR